MRGTTESIKFELAWNLMTELRKETIAAQRIRAQVTGFKITFVSAGIGLILVHADKVPIQLLIIPAIAAIFFDLLINGCSFSIKRIGFYCRCYIEPILRDYSEWPESTPLWEEFMVRSEVKHRLGLIGHLGMTCLSFIVAIIPLFMIYSLILALGMTSILVLFVIYDLMSFLKPGRTFKKCFESGDDR